MPDSFHFEAANLERLSAELTESALKLRGEVDKTVVVVGEEIKAAATTEAGKHSKSIPPTIKGEMVPGAYRIRAGGGDVALAVLYELGNRGAGGRRSDSFKHKVFGQDVWVEQKRYPFLRPALTAMRRQITKRMEAAWDKALEPLRLR